MAMMTIKSGNSVNRLDREDTAQSASRGPDRKKQHLGRQENGAILFMTLWIYFCHSYFCFVSFATSFCLFPVFCLFCLVYFLSFILFLLVCNTQEDTHEDVRTLNA